MSSLVRKATCRKFGIRLQPSSRSVDVDLDQDQVIYHFGSENVDPNADTQLEATPSKPKIQSLEAWPVTRLGGKATPEKVKVPSDAKQAWTEERWEAARDQEKVKAAKQACDIDAINNHFRMRQEHYKAK